MRWVPGTGPVGEVGAHWLCPDGDQWRAVGVSGQLMSLDLATMLGDDR